MSDTKLNQLRWRCRRGMRELDLLLCGHLDRHGATLSGAPLELFERLLACNDMDLYAWFTGRERSDDAALAQLVAAIVKEAPPGRHVTTMHGPSDDTAQPDHPPCQSQRLALAVVHISGTEASDFLQGQFCGDVRALSAGQTMLTAWCNPKGRVLFLPRVLRDLAGDFYALLPSAQTSAFIKRLRMFVLRAKVQIEDRSQDYRVIVTDGAVPASNTELVQGVDGDRCWLLAPHSASTVAASSHTLPMLDDNSALLSDIRRGEPQLDGALAEQFLPQELNLDLLAGVSFNKGCYAGQEIVARVKFRGSVKRRVQRYSLASGTAPAAGSRIVGPDEVAHGTVLASARATPGLWEILAVVDLDVGAIHLAGGDRAPLKMLPLPYTATGA